MSTVGENYFSEHCLEDLDRLDDDGLVVTRDFVPYAKVEKLGPGEHRPRGTRPLEGKVETIGVIGAPAHPLERRLVMSQR